MANLECGHCKKPFRTPAVAESDWEYQYCTYACLQRRHDKMRQHWCSKYKIAPGALDALAQEMEFCFYNAKAPSHVRRHPY